jgi:hypothetical protein
VNDHRLDRAVAPNLFDVILDPDLVFTLILANLMSPRLWELHDKVQASPGESAQQIQEFLDHHFEHVSPARVAEIDGVLDLDLLDAQYGKEAIESTRANILTALEWRVKRGTMNRDDLAIDLIEQRKFPAYTYGTIDEMWACRRLLQQRKHKPFGLTCCLDEAAIFAALLFTLAEHSVSDVAFLGSPTHYTVFNRHADATWWFYSKHELFSAASWSQLVAEKYGGDKQTAFDDRLPDFDRVINASGRYALATGENSMPEPRLAAILQQIEAFFGFRPAQLDRALHRQTQSVAGLDVSQIVSDAASASNPKEACKRVRQAALDHGNAPAVRALYTYRTLDVPDLSAYLRAARHSSQVSDRLPHVETIDDAMQSVSAIARTESIFEDPNRIAMPDETVRFATGTSRDKALLLHVLLERVLKNDDPAKTTLETLFSEAGSFVRSARFCISVSNMSYALQPEGEIRYRIADKP